MHGFGGPLPGNMPFASLRTHGQKGERDEYLGSGTQLGIPKAVGCGGYGGNVGSLQHTTTLPRIAGFLPELSWRKRGRS